MNDYSEKRFNLILSHNERAIKEEEVKQLEKYNERLYEIADMLFDEKIRFKNKFIEYMMIDEITNIADRLQEVIDSAKEYIETL